MKEIPGDRKKRKRRCEIKSKNPGKALGIHDINLQVFLEFFLGSEEERNPKRRKKKQKKRQYEIKPEDPDGQTIPGSNMEVYTQGKTIRKG